MEQYSISFEPVRREYTVSSLTAEIRELLNDAYEDIWVSGEISGTKRASSGHWYFTLKDEAAQIRCACFRNAARYLKFTPEDGLAVRARGRIDVYEPRGEYQLLVETLEPLGFGALQLAFDQLKKKLAAEGLFDAERKKPLPSLPHRIGIVTSPTGAAIRDMIHVLTRRMPGIHIRLYPAQVQGEGSIDAVCEGIAYFATSGWADVVIVGRGGGSLEDLWTFNEEEVARAIAACPVPIVSAVGHETDFTIADFAADLRAPTPSAAAELVVPTQDSLVERIGVLEARAMQRVRLVLAMRGRQLEQQGVERVTASLHRRIGRGLQRIDELEYRVRFRMNATLEQGRRRWQQSFTDLARLDLRLRFARVRERLEQLDQRGASQITRLLARARGRLEPQTAQLVQLSPLKILDRGYAIVENEQGHVVKSPADAPAGEQIRVRLAKGELRAKVAKERTARPKPAKSPDA